MIFVNCGIMIERGRSLQELQRFAVAGGMEVKQAQVAIGSIAMRRGGDGGSKAGLLCGQTGKYGLYRFVRFQLKRLAGQVLAGAQGCVRAMAAILTTESCRSRTASSIRSGRSSGFIVLPETLA